MGASSVFYSCLIILSSGCILEQFRADGRKSVVEDRFTGSSDLVVEEFGNWNFVEISIKVLDLDVCPDYRLGCLGDEG